MPGNVGRKRPPKDRYRMRVTLTRETVEYLTGWHDRTGRNIGHSEVIEELVGYAISGGMDKVVEDDRIDISDLEPSAPQSEVEKEK